MAVEGLQNVSVLESRFHGENDSLASRRWDHQDRLSTRTSSIREMWRELEGERKVDRIREGRTLCKSFMGKHGLESPISSGGDANSKGSFGDLSEVENEPVQCPQSQIESQKKDESNSCLHISPAFSTAERERVRRVFRDWGNSCFEDTKSYVSCSNSYSRSDLLGENERRRVRIVREWIEMTTQQKDPCARREAKAAEIGSQIEQVRNGLVVDHSKIGNRRLIHTVCGRQALVDLITRFSLERKRELQDLSEHGYVSKFSHRNRIQALLRGRFLQNRRLIHDEQPTSLAAKELYLLRQSSTVSYLRKGFLSRSDSYVLSTQCSTQSDTLSDSGISEHSNEQAQQEIVREPLDDNSDEFEAPRDEIDTEALSNDELDDKKCSDLHRKEFISMVKKGHGPILGCEEQLISAADSILMMDCVREVGSECWEETNGNEWSRGSFVIECRSQGSVQEVKETIDNFDIEHNGVGRELLEVQCRNNSSEINGIEDLDWEDDFAHVEDWHKSVSENDESAWHYVHITESEEGTEDSNHGWYPEIAGSDLQEFQEELSQVDQEENAENLLERMLWQDVAPMGRIATSYSFGDDNGRSTELKELTSRRRVSNLRQSGFSEHLNQLIQSYLRRQVDNLDERMLGSASTSSSFRYEQLNADNVGDFEVVDRSDVDLPSPQEIIPEAYRHADLHDAGVQQLPDIHQPFGIREWNIITGLRHDMFKLQERMNDLQRMLETCMDRQLELRQLVLQDVSAALHRSSDSTGSLSLNNIY